MAFSFGLPPLDVKLNGQNYREWALSQNATLLLQACGFASHLTEDPPAASTDANDKAVKGWCLDDDRVMAAIGMNVELSIRSCLEDHSTAKEMWDHLKARYQQSSSTLRYSIRQNLHYLQQQQDMSVEEYYVAFTKLSSQLASMVPVRLPMFSV
jgi:hypothetical protein